MKSLKSLSRPMFALLVLALVSQGCASSHRAQGTARSPLASEEFALVENVHGVADAGDDFGWTLRPVSDQP